MSDMGRKIAFVLELEKLKQVFRKTRPVGTGRRENSAEHSWQATLTALIFLDDAPDALDALKVLKMMLIHDLVEIDSGDVFVYDAVSRATVKPEEEKAATRICGLLPDPLGRELLDLWLEFEAESTPEARYAKAIDRVNPVLQNLASAESSWQEFDISREQVLAVNERIGTQLPDLWRILETGINDSPHLRSESEAAE